MSEDDCPGTNEAMQGLWKENSDLVGFISLTLILFCTTKQQLSISYIITNSNGNNICHLIAGCQRSVRRSYILVRYLDSLS